MRKVLMLFGAIIATSLAIQKIIQRKPINSREDDPTIPPVSANAF